MNCTACPALRYPITSGVCAMGFRTATTAKDGYRVRHPLETCKRPASDGDMANYMEIIAKDKIDCD
jgi:hypothetical protein